MTTSFWTTMVLTFIAFATAAYFFGTICAILRDILRALRDIHRELQKTSKD